MLGITACMHRNAPLRLTAIVTSKSCSVSSSTVRTRPTPALFTRMSIGPSSRSTLFTISATSDALDTSAGNAHALQPPL
jgi:hypothetical protein